jgi:hypothetical protein
VPLEIGLKRPGAPEQLVKIKIAGQEKRLVQSEGSKPPPRRLVEVSIPTAELGRYVSQFNVGFGKLIIENNAERAVSVGSGTLVSIGSRKGILTAGHVLTALPDHQEIALIMSSEGPSIYRATKLLMSNARKLTVPGYAVGPDGPDLGFLHISDVDAERSLLQSFNAGNGSTFQSTPFPGFYGRYSGHCARTNSSFSSRRKNAGNPIRSVLLRWEEHRPTRRQQWTRSDRFRGHEKARFHAAIEL